MDRIKLQKVLYNHSAWLEDNSTGCRANLADANLTSANLTDALGLGAYIRCPSKGTIVGYKKGAGGAIITLAIPASARRVNCIGSFKCRCDKAKVMSIVGENGLPQRSSASGSDHDFIYTVGKTVKEPKYDPSDLVECSTGIHFFITRSEAEEY